MKYLVFSFLLGLLSAALHGQDLSIEQYDVLEINFIGSTYSVKDNPVRDIILETVWQNGSHALRIYGYYDGDGKGGFSGSRFAVRFCPFTPGAWTLTRVFSNDAKLNGQKEGLRVQCQASANHGFWIPDDNSPGTRWFKRSDGTHQYFSGNTLYSFLSEYDEEGNPTGSTIKEDMEGSGQFFGKVRFSISGDIFPNPVEKPWLDLQGNPTDDGNFSHRPNPKWFRERVDLAVQTCFEKDVIADIIINGPDSKNSRSILYAAENGGDNTPVLRYIAARYGSYPNVWICLSNEFNIRTPTFTPEQVCTFGYRILEYLPYPTPLSVHANQRDWFNELTQPVPWNTHVILQNKLKTLFSAADFAEKNYWKAGGGKPTVNDELAYQGAGDGWTEEDVIEAHLGAFLGASYGTSGFKSGRKLGQYFMGDFDSEEHTAADNLKWMVEQINEHITFWKMEPTHYAYTNGNVTSIFRNIEDTFRALQWTNHEYVLGSNKACKGLVARLPEGSWTILQFDLINKQVQTLIKDAKGQFEFDVPASRAVITFFRKND